MSPSAARSTAPLPRGRLGLVIGAAIVAGGLAAFLWPRGGARGPEGAEDPFRFAPPESRPVGAPIPLRSTLAAGQRFAGTGTISYRQSGGGRYGGLPLVPTRLVRGTFTFVRRVEGGSGAPLRSTIEAKVSFTDASDHGAPVPGEAVVTLQFEHGRVDTSSLPSTKLSAPADLRPALVTLEEAFTQRTPLVGLDPREGETFVPEAAMDVEPLRRQAFKLFNFNEQGIAPVEGVVWLDRVAGRGASAEAVVVAWIRHAQAGRSSSPKKALVTTEYETVVRGRYEVGVADGLAHRAELSEAVRTRYRSDAFDYHAEIERGVTFDEAPLK